MFLATNLLTADHAMPEKQIASGAPNPTTVWEVAKTLDSLDATTTELAPAATMDLALSASTTPLANGVELLNSAFLITALLTATQLNPLSTIPHLALAAETEIVLTAELLMDALGALTESALKKTTAEPMETPLSPALSTATPTETDLATTVPLTLVALGALTLRLASMLLLILVTILLRVLPVALLLTAIPAKSSMDAIGARIPRNALHMELTALSL